jgi:DtxR family Mn-dependent transcriptional regulator
MLPSQTVENYLKTIFQAQASLAKADALVPMGQIASALGVVPGTATTMIKTLAESGLVDYEPYMGVRLTEAGRRLAGRVLRRHRLVELFLVRILGMSWAEVHDEAERLEHAVSDRVIERMDQMLGHPAVDPHGDPIPTAEGTLASQDYVDLLAAPTGIRLVIERVLDQDADFLRFIEARHLIPGTEVVVESRDLAADAVKVRSMQGESVTVGTRAASKLLVSPLS